MDLDPSAAWQPHRLDKGMWRGEDSSGHGDKKEYHRNNDNAQKAMLPHHRADDKSRKSEGLEQSDPEEE